MFISPLATTGAQACRRTVLNIEDNPANALLVESIVQQSSDLRLLTATNGIQGIKMAVLNLPDVILMDIKLPDIDGYGVLDILLDNFLTKHVPVIALSSFAHPNDVERGLKAGFYRYLTKPYKICDLLASIDSATCHSQNNANLHQPALAMTCAAESH